MSLLLAHLHASGLPEQRLGDPLLPLSSFQRLWWLKLQNWGLQKRLHGHYLNSVLWKSRGWNSGACYSNSEIQRRFAWSMDGP